MSSDLENGAAQDPASDEVDRAPAAWVADLERLLDVEMIDVDLFRGAARPEGRGRVFGGQVIAQALAAAMRSVEEGRRVHSLHAYFMRIGNENLPIIFRVLRDFEGRSFATRRVVATQGGVPILNFAASFQQVQEGPAHQCLAPSAPAPEDLPPLPDRAGARRRRPIEMRAAPPEQTSDPAKRMFWFRAAAPLSSGGDLHRAVLAYASDFGLLGASMAVHDLSFRSPGLQSASLDHALWFHAPCRLDDWLLYVTESPWTGWGRGLNRGQIFDRAGRLIASVTQESLLRIKGFDLARP